jgi:sugar/nucleoside kinase (ribokinase family)
MTSVNPHLLDVLTIGESMALLVAEEPGPLVKVQRFSKKLAGADSNVAIGLARLGFKVGWVSRLGEDSFGHYVHEAIAAEGVDVSQVVRDPVRLTGIMLKAQAVGGQDPKVEYHRRGSAASALSLADLPLPYALGARHFHATGITPALSVDACALVAHTMQAMRKAGRTVSLDPNLRPSLWPNPEAMRATLLQLASHADWVLPGIEEGRLLTGCESPPEIANYFLRMGAQAVVIKLGAEGAYFRTLHEAGMVPGVVVPQVVDTVGAGDAFAAGCISAKLEGKTWTQAVSRANWMGAQAIQVIGDMEGLPQRHELPAGL